MNQYNRQLQVTVYTFFSPPRSWGLNMGCAVMYIQWTYGSLLTGILHWPTLQALPTTRFPRPLCLRSHWPLYEDSDKILYLQLSHPFMWNPGYMQRITVPYISHTRIFWNFIYPIKWLQFNTLSNPHNESIHLDIVESRKVHYIDTKKIRVSGGGKEEMSGWVRGQSNSFFSWRCQRVHICKSNLFDL